MTDTDEEFDPSKHLGLGVIDGLVVIYAFGLPVLLDASQARDIAAHLIEAADLVEWHEEIYGDQDEF